MHLAEEGWDRNHLAEVEYQMHLAEVVDVVLLEALDEDLT